MNTEYEWLALSILVTSLIWLPIIVNRLIEHGFWHGLWDPEGEIHTKVGWSRRMMAAHTNAIENLVIFAPLVIMVQQLHLEDDLTLLASMLFFYSRLAHVFLFTFKVPVLRIIAFLTGFSAQLILIKTILGWSIL